MRIVSLGVACSLSAQVSFAQAATSGSSKPSVVFSVSGDRTLDYPAAQFLGLPDEQQTFLPKPGSDWSSRPPGYYVVAAMLNNVNGTRYGWTFLLQSDDLLHFSLVPGAGDPAHGGAIFWPAHSLLKGPAGCNYPGVTHFDEQYAAPGSVLQDPARAPGSMIMIYESEIHCPWSKGGGGVGWVSVGVAHSQTPGGGPHTLPQVQWPKPIAARGYENNWLDYGNGRYAGLTIPGVPQTTGQFERFNGDSLPSAFIDDVNPSREKYLYVLYTFTGSPVSLTDGKVHIARAKLSARNAGHIPAKLEFRKWYKGGWNAPGIQTNLPAMKDDGIDPPGCGGLSFAGNPSVMYNEALQKYMLVYVCHRIDCSTKPCRRVNLSWYYRTTTDLATQQWSVPQLISNSTYAITSTTDGNGNVHYSEDGLHPTFMTPGCAPGHIGLTGFAFLLNGDPLGPRVYARRTFAIHPGSAPVRKACDSDGARE